MATERFSIGEFEAALDNALDALHPLQWEQSGLMGGEFRYEIQVQEDPIVWVLVNSSIDVTGYAQDTGQNSIRVWMVDDDGKPLGNKTQAYVTRVSGWQQRMADVLADVIEMAQAVDYCPVCGEVMRVFIAKRGKNKGRAFRKCMASGCVFEWLDELDDAVPTCPECGANMVERHGKHGVFWGCSRFPTCRGTRNIDDVTREVAAKREARSERQQELPLTVSISKPREFEPSKYQKVIFEEVQDGAPGEHVVIEAGAGTGKTTTGVKMLGYLPSNLRVVFTAFNRHIAKEMRQRVSRNTKATTTHSLGWAVIRRNVKNLTDDSVNNDKVKILFKQILDWEMYKAFYPVVSDLVSKAKANLVEPTIENLDFLCDRYGILVDSEQELIYDAVTMIMELAKEMTHIVDFDDMIWLPVVLDMTCPTYDFIFADEAQDLNKAQIELLLRHANNGSRIFVVGDRYQSMYGFRGADVDAIPHIIDRLGAKTLPLSLSYRCPKSVVRLVNKEFPMIPFEATEWAEEGVVRTTNGLHNEELVDGDMVLCRTNAPLVAPAFGLIRRGIKATIIGRDIGKGLIGIIKKYRQGTLADTIHALAMYRNEEYAKLVAAEKMGQAQSLEDKIDTIIAVADGCYTVDDVISKILQVFSDDAEGVVFSTVHRAKGLEADRVFILRPELMPHPMAEHAWEFAQEQNIKYVAYTRTKRELVFVDPKGVVQFPI